MWRWLIALALVAQPAPSDACSCLGSVTVIGVRVPRNAHVRVIWPSDLVELDESSLQLVPASGIPGPVAVERRIVARTGYRVITLIPRLPLVAERAYDVRGAAKRGGEIKVIGTVVATDAIDDKPPNWGGVAAPILEPGERSTSCSTGQRWVRLAFAGTVSDDHAPADELVYGVWLADAPFDAKAPPIALVRPRNGRLELGHPSICAPRDFELPAKPTKLRLAPIDLAGNIGTPVDVSIGAR